MQSLRDQIARIFKILEVVVRCAADPLGDGGNIICGVKFPDNGGAEFVIDAAALKQCDASVHVIQREIRNANSLRILVRAVFDAFQASASS